MDAIMEAIFVGAGYAVGAIGGVLAMLLVGLLPIYAYGLFLYFQKASIRSTRLTLMLFIASMVLSVILLAVFAITAVAMGAWG